MGFVGLCLLVGAAAGAITAGAARGWYLSLTSPDGTPPRWVLGPVWSTLYVMMGVAGWLAWRRSGAGRPLRLWGWQLAANAAWAPAFFGLRNPALGLAVVVLLLALIVATMQSFWRVRRAAVWLLVPYAVWTSYAAYLNAGFWWLNRG